MEASAHIEHSNIEDDSTLIELMNRAARSLQQAGLSTQDLLDELPTAQDQLLREDLGDEFVNALIRMHPTMQHP
jgi:hypothetical protein